MCVLNNYEEYYNKLFLNFDFKKIEDKLHNLSKNIVDKLNLDK